MDSTSNDRPSGTRTRLFVMGAVLLAVTLAEVGVFVRRGGTAGAVVALAVAVFSCGFALVTAVELARRLVAHVPMRPALRHGLEGLALGAFTFTVEPLHTLRGDRAVVAALGCGATAAVLSALARRRTRVWALGVVATCVAAAITHLSINSALHGAVHAGACLAVLLAVASLGEWVRPSRPVPTGGLVAASVAGLVATTVALADPASRARFHAGSATSRATAAAFLFASDVDLDGSASVLGSVDCAPFDPRRGPHVSDRPGDGIDADCDGVDLPQPGRVPEVAPPVARDADVVIVSLDAVRADVAHHLVAIRRALPNAFEFTRAVSPTSRTLNSFGAMLRGRAASDVPFDRRVIAGGVLPGGPRTLGHALRGAGYHAGFVPTHTYVSPRTRVAEGFEEWRLPRMPYDDPRKSGNDTVVDAETALRLLLTHASAVRGPVVVMTHLMETHEPYRSATGRRYTDDRAGYLAALVEQDARVEAFLERFRVARGREPIVVVLADHGEAFGEHGNRRHTSSVHAEQVRVPLLLSVPGLTGHTIDAPISTTALPATLLELVGVRPDPSFVQRSLLACMRDASRCPEVAVSELRVLGRATDVAQRAYTTASGRVLVDRAHDTALHYGADDPHELRPRLTDGVSAVRTLSRLDDGRW